jgi:hydrogenase-4 membrane subunit HyfE
MGPAIEHGNIIVTLMAVHLLLSIAASEVRDLRMATVALIFQSATLGAIFAAFGVLWNQPWLFAWSASVIATKAILIPLLLFAHIKNFPARELRPFIGFRVSIALIVVFLLVFYRFVHTYMFFIAPTTAAMMEPARSSLAIAFSIFALGVYVCIVRRDVVKIVIGIILLENGAHLSLVTLAPSLPETTVLGVTSNIVVATWLLLTLAGYIYKALGTTDTSTLSELRR